MRFSSILLSAFFLLITVLVSALNNKKYDEAVVTVKKTNKLALPTIESPDGDSVGRVIKRKQPAFDHYLLKDGMIQRLPTQRKRMRRHYKYKSSADKVSQIWFQNGTRRLKDTIPIRRSTIGDVMEVNSVSEFKKRKHSFYHQLVTQEKYDYAVAKLETTRKVYGAQATINLWKPLVYEFDYSTAQMLIKSGIENNLDTIEVGWHVYPSLYGDYNARLFISWKNDSYRGSGCYNIFCEGFKDTSGGTFIGNSFDFMSHYNGEDKYMTVDIFKEQSCGCWLLHVNGKEVGYWPGNIFTQLSEVAYQVDWGGEVYRRKIEGGEYRATQMGSGSFPTAGYRRACYIKDLKVAYSYHDFVDVGHGDLSRWTTDDQSYNISTPIQYLRSGTSFYFGGRG